MITHKPQKQSKIIFGVTDYLRQSQRRRETIRRNYGVFPLDADHQRYRTPHPNLFLLIQHNRVVCPMANSH
jgi:hypothetical protein